jgi:hypothetical protein
LGYQGFSFLFPRPSPARGEGVSGWKLTGSGLKKGRNFLGLVIARKRPYFDRTREKDKIREGRFWDD